MKAPSPSTSTPPSSNSVLEFYPGQTLELPVPPSWSSPLPSLPSAPGVYWYLGAKNNILYVGKAKNLNNRLKSYRLTSTLLPKTRQMLQQSTSLHLQILETEVDALILEAELVRRHQPPYNSLLKDDKSPLYIVITKETYPRVFTVRKTDLSQTKSIYQTIFGPYPSGRDAKALLKFSRRLFPFCNASNGEKRKHMACFYYHLHLCPGACIGKISAGNYQYTIRHLKLFLKGKRHKVIQELTSQLNFLSKNQEYEAASHLKQTLLFLKKPYTRITSEGDIPNLTTDLAYETERSLHQLLRPHLNLPHQYAFNRIEAYDISHLQGSDSTASMVVFEKCVPQPSSYRRFRIKTVSGINDPAMLVETLVRRLKHAEWPYPQLIVLDGGKIQLKTVLKNISTSIPIISIAKNPDRLMVFSKEGKVIEIKNLFHYSGFRLIQHLRDEAHRFTKNYHTLLHVKTYTIT